MSNSTTALVRARDDAINFTHQGLEAENAKDYVRAAELHSRALELKIDLYGTNHAATAMSYNSLGDALTRLGRLDEAEEMLMNAFDIRERQGAQFDFAVTREYIGALREAQGRREEAIEIRKRGSEGGKKEMLCSSQECPGQMFALEDLKRCDGCGAPFYCSVDCQKHDWNERHKAFCAKLQESIKKDT